MSNTFVVNGLLFTTYFKYASITPENPFGVDPSEQFH
nr:MAG TPA: hypothetical protein [Caudoviricetes sp.]DAT77259.1 MAG TPA: hypothetical protein [Caudoviricetes sp.]